LAYSSFCLHYLFESVNYHTQPTFHIISILHLKPILHCLCNIALLNRLSTYMYLCLITNLHYQPNTYNIRMPLKEYVVALLVSTSRLEFNSRCAIGIFHLHQILLILLWPLGSVINKYQKYFLRGKGVQCEGLTTLPSSSLFAIFSA